MPNFEQLSTMYIYKHQSFPLSMLTFGQRSINFLSLSWKLDKSCCHNDYANISEKGCTWHSQNILQICIYGFTCDGLHNIGIWHFFECI